MRRALAIGIVLLSIVHPKRLSAAEAEPTGEAARALKVISELDDVDSMIRRQATLQLNSLGGAALPIVEKAKASPAGLSPERQRRLQQALSLLRARAHEEGIRSARRQWLQKIILDAYTAGGHANPKWDGAAHKAFDAYLTSSLNPQGNEPRLMRTAVNAAAAAIDLGCDDPMLLLICRLQAGGQTLGTLEAKVPQWGKCRFELMQKKYDNTLFLWLDVDEVRGFPMNAMILYQDWIRRFEQIANARATPPEHLDFLGRRIFRTLNSDPSGRHAIEFLKAYKRISGKTIGTLLCDSDVIFITMSHQLWATDANFPEAWRGQTDNLAEAEKINLEAEAIDPLDPRPAVELVRIKMRQINATLDDFNKVFDHAVALSPDQYLIYEEKLNYLSPEWRGDEKSLRDFGRQCLETENWRGGIPMMLIQLHEYFASKTDDAETYFARADVRNDINDVFAPHLLNFPDDVKTRCTYAKYAMRCNDWLTAKSQFDIIGDNFDHAVFPSKEIYEHDRDKAARLAARP